MDGEDTGVILLDRNSELTQHAQGAETILAPQIVAQPARSVAQGGQQGGAVGHAFITRDGEVRFDPQGTMNTNFHG